MCRPVVLYIVCGHRRVGDPVVDDGVDAHRHRVPGEDLRDIEVFMSIHFLHTGGGERAR